MGGIGRGPLASLPSGAYRCATSWAHFSTSCCHSFISSLSRHCSTSARHCCICSLWLRLSICSVHSFCCSVHSFCCFALALICAFMASCCAFWASSWAFFISTMARACPPARACATSFCASYASRSSAPAGASSCQGTTVGGSTGWGASLTPAKVRFSVSARSWSCNCSCWAISSARRARSSAICSDSCASS